MSFLQTIDRRYDEESYEIRQKARVLAVLVVIMLVLIRVVAQEVKHLAEQSSKATTQVRSTLGSIQGAIASVVLLARAGRERAEAGVTSIENTGHVIRDLGDSISMSVTSAKEIAIRANEQNLGLEQIAQAMAMINGAAAATEQSTQQVERGGQKLNEMARRLEELVSRQRGG
jgi:methyl-accepting chemotaxis protein